MGAPGMLACAVWRMEEVLNVRQGLRGSVGDEGRLEERRLLFVESIHGEESRRGDERRKESEACVERGPPLLALQSKFREERQNKRALKNS